MEISCTILTVWKDIYAFLEANPQIIYPLGSTILASIIVPWIGLLIYFRQKEYELVRKRYLEDGIDILIQQVEAALTTFQDNYTHSMLVLKTYRELKADTPSHLYEIGFQGLDDITMVPTRNYLLKELIGDDVFYDAHQLMTVFVHDANNYFINGLCSTIRIKIKGGEKLKITATEEQIVETYLRKSIEYNDEAKKYWILLGNLQNIAFAFEKQRFTFKTIKGFHKNKSVKKSVATVKKAFEDEFKNIKSNIESKEEEAIDELQSDLLINILSNAKADKPANEYEREMMDKYVNVYEKSLIVDKKERMIDILNKYGHHSFDWFREHTDLNFSDSEFLEVIASTPKLKFIRIVKNDDNGKRVFPGRPGVALRA